MEDILVTGCAVAKNLARMILLDVPHKPGMAARVFAPLAGRNIIVDDIVQSAFTPGSANITFTISRDEIDACKLVLEELRKDIGYGKLIVDDKVAKVSIVGVGMRAHSGVAEKMFSALASAGVNIEMITTSEIKVSTVIPEADADKALRVVHDAFNLGNEG